jgi:hypothetical protein
MKLTTLSDCIQDAVATRNRLTAQISSIIEKNSKALELPRAVEQAADHISKVLDAAASERERLEASRRKLEDLKASLASRREAMSSGRAAQIVGERYLADNCSTLSRCKTTISSTREAISAQQQRIVATLMDIFPITPSPDGEALSFHIRGLHLPSMNHEDADPAEIAAALGHVAQLIYLLSYYLGCPLRYPVKPCGSRSFVRDDISVIQGARTFPLWIKGAVYYRFEYAVFLINKDVQQLMDAVGMHCVDIRHTLANLKSLGLFVAAGGVVGGGGAGGTGSKVPTRSSTPVPRNGNGNRAQPPRRTSTPAPAPTQENELRAKHVPKETPPPVVKPAYRPYSFFAGRGV